MKEFLSFPSSDLAPFLASFVAAAFAAWLLTFFARKLALSQGVVAHRDQRRRHEGDTPLLGGVPFYLVIVVGTLLAWKFPWLVGGTELSVRYVACFLGAVTCVFGIGAIDDVHELKAPPKFAAQALAAGLMLFSQPDLPPMLQGLGLPNWVVAGGLGLWIVGITNAMNMIDGMDGLCAGIAGISATTFAVIAMQGSAAGHPLLMMILLAGACAGFLFHNFNPARIFLGDSGSLLLGFVLAVASVQFEFKRTLLVSLSLPILLLGVPLMDIVFSMFRRARRGRSPFSGDRGHIHHRLQRLGLRHRSAVLVLWVAAGYLNLVAYFLSRIPADYTGYMYGAVFPIVAFGITGLYFMEKRLSYLNAKFGRLFVRDGHALFSPTSVLRSYVREKIEIYEGKKTPFAVVVVDTTEIMAQFGDERPIRVVEFYLRLSAILRDRLRSSDLIVRDSRSRILIVLGGVGQELITQQGSVIDYLRTSIKELQLVFHVFQSDPKNPEGFRAFSFPDDALAIRDVVAASVDADSGTRVRAA